MDSKIILYCFGVFLLVNVCAGEVVTDSIRECLKASDKINSCNVTSVSVEPCPSMPCEFPRGSNATITVKCIPSKKITKRARHGYFWEQSATLDLPFAGINPKACKNMKCPARKNKEVTYEAVIPIRQNLPGGTFNIKNKVYEGRTNHFCIAFTIKLT